MGTSKRLLLNPPKSHPCSHFSSPGATRPNVGASFTSSSYTPWTKLDSTGMGISGLMRIRCSRPGSSGFLMTVPSGISLTMAISTMRSTPTLVPVVSRSKNTKGRFKCSRATCSIMFRKFGQRTATSMRTY